MSADSPAPPASKPERDLLCLVYVSTAAPGLTDADLEAIATRSAARNHKARLTGLLLHEGNNFHGILEGQRRQLFACMERIITDPRHTGVEVLIEAPATSRRFAAWSFRSLPVHATRPALAERFIRTFGSRMR